MSSARYIKDLIKEKDLILEKLEEDWKNSDAYKIQQEENKGLFWKFMLVGIIVNTIVFFIFYI